MHRKVENFALLLLDLLLCWDHLLIPTSVHYSPSISFFPSFYLRDENSKLRKKIATTCERLDRSYARLVRTTAIRRSSTNMPNIYAMPNDKLLAAANMDADTIEEELYRAVNKLLSLSLRLVSGCKKDSNHKQRVLDRFNLGTPLRHSVSLPTYSNYQSNSHLQAPSSPPPSSSVGGTPSTSSLSVSLPPNSPCGCGGNSTCGQCDGNTCSSCGNGSGSGSGSRVGDGSDGGIVGGSGSGGRVASCSCGGTEQ
jgi:hypothetical protein